ncbi:sugar 3,4-ketoisomerase [Leptospira meyeri]|uniref:sugar 3,4-ketoisomerase n=1 Tax=Leptospira meyeri TaxID=29508 RepID=UPI000C2974BF|nr:FdtA/QdtA family cupin domain-containing protein [Leptospira meyeri]PJZ79407.1 fatty-acid oxidation protein subunit alpha [Leptospira meyeri]PJZ98527.1 fatty-acid oxidation protein subunit alpha [Leptospira meyeri]
MDELIVKNSGYVRLKQFVDQREGSLTVAESNRDIPFEIMRTYYIIQKNASDVTRGNHAHKETIQVIFCLSGSFVLHLDDGKNTQKILMNESNLGVILGKELWHSMESISSDCIMLVYASDYFDEDDYLRKYDEFLKYIAEKKND